jgi:hypothetical protein
MKPGEKVRESDYADDIAVHEEAAVPTHFDPDTGQRIKKTAITVIAVLVIGFIAVRVDRFFKDRAVSISTEQAATARIPVDVSSRRRRMTAGAIHPKGSFRIKSVKRSMPTMTVR